MPKPSVDALAVACRRRKTIASAHDLFGKPDSTWINRGRLFPDHALPALLGFGLELRLERRELGEWRIRIRRLLAPFRVSFWRRSCRSRPFVARRMRVAGRVHGAGGRSADRRLCRRRWRGMAFGLGGVGRAPADRRSAHRAPSIRPAERKRPHLPRPPERRRPASRCLAACLPAWRCLPCGRRRPSDRPGRQTSIISGSLGAVAAASLAGTETSSAIAGANGASGTGSLADRRRLFSATSGAAGEPDFDRLAVALPRRAETSMPRPPHRRPPARPKLRLPPQSSRLLPAWRPPRASRQAAVRQSLWPRRSPAFRCCRQRSSRPGRRSAGSAGFGRRSMR